LWIWAGLARANAPASGKTRIHLSQYAITVLTCVCWSIVSEIQIA
jgi:hypothetical protein